MVSGLSNRRKLVQIEGITRVTLSVRFKIFFDHPIPPGKLWIVFPPKFVLSGADLVYGTDGKFLHRNGVFLIHRDVTHGENLYWSFWKSESYLAFDTDLKILSRLITDSNGSFPNGAVSDWKGAIVSAVSMHFGPVPHQRCLTHVTRMAKRLLPENSPFAATRSLRKIAQELIFVENWQEEVDWLWSLKVWEEKYGYMLKAKTIGVKTRKRWWYTHGNLRRGYRLLTHEQEPFFVHLNHPLIKHSNNSLEGVNSQLKQKLGEHRGMRTNQQVSFLSWYLTFKRIKSYQDLKKLWGVWKSEFSADLPTRNLT